MFTTIARHTSAAAQMVALDGFADWRDDLRGRNRFRRVDYMVERPTQGDGPAGTISSKIGRAEHSNFTNWPKASLPCCQQVRKTLARICCVRAPLEVRLPPQVLRAMAISRIARSAKLLVASKPGQRRKVNRCGCSWHRCLANR